MTKLEEKLTKLGYSLYKGNGKIDAVKSFRLQEDRFELNICILENKIIDYSMHTHRMDYYNQSQIDNQQQAFNQLQQDLEVLNNYERLD